VSRPPAAVAYYAVAERRIAPGRIGDYMEAIEAIHRSLVSARGRLTMRVYISESDPEAVLTVSGWTQREDGLVAFASIEPGHAERLARVSVQEQPLRWFVTEREITTFINQPTVAAASLMSVAPEEMPVLVNWARRGQDRVAGMDDVIATQVLRAQDDPGHMLVLVEYRDAAGRAAVQAMVAADRPPVPILGSRVFVGRVGRRWDRGDPV
jgi:heme-degrading monooxygenase HmoA